MGDPVGSETPASMPDSVTEVRKLSNHAKAAGQEREIFIGNQFPVTLRIISPKTFFN